MFHCFTMENISSLTLNLHPENAKQIQLLHDVLQNLLKEETFAQESIVSLMAVAMENQIETLSQNSTTISEEFVICHQVLAITIFVIILQQYLS
jgi:hypothetical protein